MRNVTQWPILFVALSVVTTACSLIGGLAASPPSWLASLQKDTVTASRTNFGGGSVVLFANGTKTPLSAVSLRLDGIRAEDVIGGIEPCEAVPNTPTLICKLDKALAPNSGGSIFYTGKATRVVFGYLIEGKAVIRELDP